MRGLIRDSSFPIPRFTVESQFLGSGSGRWRQAVHLPRQISGAICDHATGRARCRTVHLSRSELTPEGAVPDGCSTQQPPLPRSAAPSRLAAAPLWLLLWAGVAPPPEACRGPPFGSRVNCSAHGSQVRRDAGHEWWLQLGIGLTSVAEQGGIQAKLAAVASACSARPQQMSSGRI